MTRVATRALTRAAGAAVAGTSACCASPSAQCAPLSPKERAFSQFVLELPTLLPALLSEMVRGDIGDPHRRKLGIATLRDVALRRDRSARAALGYLLELSTEGAPLDAEALGGVSEGRPDEGGAGDGADAASSDARSDAIKVIASSLAPAPHLSGIVHEYAAARLAEALGAGDEPVAAQGEAPGVPPNAPPPAESRPMWSRACSST